MNIDNFPTARMLPEINFQFFYTLPVLYSKSYEFELTKNPYEN